MFMQGFYQKRFGGNNKITAASIKMGSTKGKGSTTRMLNYCTKHTNEPSQCITSFITVR